VAAARGVVRAGVSATLRDYLRRYPGLDLDRLALEAGLDPKRIGDPDRTFDQLGWFTFVEAAAQAAGDPYLAIGYAEQMPWKDLGVLGYVLRNSPTVGDALANMARYFAIQQSAGHIELDGGRLVYSVADPRISDHGQIAEATFALLVRLVREASADPGWAPSKIEFRHEAPSDLRRHQRFFRGTLKFGARTNTLTVATGDLARVFVAADAGLLPHLLKHATDLLANRAGDRGDDDPEEEVRRTVIVALNAGEPDIASVAARLGQSTRSMQRRLAESGVSFSELVESTRRELAERYLADPQLTLTETGFLLGYSDLSAFSRAYKRWTGKSPIASRAAPTAASSRRSTRSR
jgi:AraC-like DNA-binding protein